ncbi:MAG: hypothetical protein NXI24_04800 [bacterium]|nr:hypothetical protein [bacterium]
MKRSGASFIILVALFCGLNAAFAYLPTQAPTDGLLEGKFRTGSERFLDGTYQVSVKTSLPGVTADMVRFWFAAYLQTTEHYKRWYPGAHFWMDWEAKRPGRIVGASHLVHENIGPDLMKLRIHFVDPARFFQTDPNNEETFVVCAIVGELELPVDTGRMCHIVRNVPGGAVMHSRFWLGQVAGRGETSGVFRLAALANLPAIRFMALRRSLATDLEEHCKTEMSILGGFLPEIYRADWRSTL